MKESHQLRILANELEDLEENNNKLSDREIYNYMNDICIRLDKILDNIDRREYRLWNWG